MGSDLLTTAACLNIIIKRKGRSMLQRRQYKISSDKVYRLATKEYRSGKTAGRVKATQVTDENSIVIVK